MKNCVIVSAARTATGSYLGSLKTEPEQYLAAAAIREAADRAGLEKDQVDQVIMGNVAGISPNIARVGLLLAGFPVEVPAYSVDRQCGSGLQAVIGATYEIQAGNADTVIAGGAECMSGIPYYMPASTRYEARRMGDFKVLDGFMSKSSNAHPPELYPNLNMGVTAENVAKNYGITRQQQDEFALHSQQKACTAIDEGKFKDEIFAYQVKQRKLDFSFEVDEYPRRDTNLEKLGKLRASFLDGGTVTAGNSSGMNDGSSAVVVMSEEKATALGKTPLVRIVDTSTAGVNPSIMGMGPVPAIRQILQQQGLALQDIDLFEINEAFAAQSLGVLMELGMAPGTALYDRVNVSGGAIALGHALGSSGTRILTTLIYELKRRNGRYGIAALCIGGGQGIAALVENC